MYGQNINKWLMTWPPLFAFRTAYLSACVGRRNNTLNE